MMNGSGLWARYMTELGDDPLMVLALTAALVAFASTPIAFAVLGRLDWFKARRGRVLQRPEFSSIVVGMLRLSPGALGRRNRPAGCFHGLTHARDRGRQWPGTSPG